MDFLQLMQTRYTTKHYDPNKRISDEDFNKILECTRLSPSSVNMQPWHFYVASTREQKEKLKPCILDFNMARVDNASHVIAICAYTKIEEARFKQVLDKEIKDGRLTDEHFIQLQDSSRHHFASLHAASEKDMLIWSSSQAYITLATIMYAAASMGIDSTAIEGFNAEVADEILNLKEKHLHCVCLVSLGYRSSDDSNTTEKRPKSRLAKEDVFTAV